MDKIKKEISYQPFSTFVFRTPYISFQEFTETMERLDTDESYWKEFLQNKVVQEAIFLGTPVLYNEIQKYLAGALTVPKEIERLKLSVVRYYTRMSTRCTPFGLFAGFSLGQLGEATGITLSDPSNYGRCTRLDMNYLCNLAQDLSKMPEVRKYLNYYPNNSLYLLGEKIRYVEYYFQNAKRVHNISAVDNSDYLELVLSKAHAGCTIDELAALLVDDAVSLDEATEFINELIAIQLLVSEMEPVLTGKDFLAQLLTILQPIPTIAEQKNKLRQIATLLAEIDAGEIGQTHLLYSAIEEMVKEIGTAYEPKFLFQTDMFKPAKKSTLNKEIVQTVQEALELMNKLTLVQSETLLAKFAENYYERYEDKEMPLLQVLDSENGIGYRENTGDVNPLLNGYAFPSPPTSSMDIKWNRIQSVLHKKLVDAYKMDAFEVAIQEKDFEFLTTDWTNLPPTIACMCQVFSLKKDEPLIFVHSSGGSSAANLLGRFCHVTKELENYVLEITQYEQAQNPDVIYAEIVHLPESRIGNILLRPVLRPYEIPYLGKSAVEAENQLPLSDLYISVRGRQVLLRSKRLNKQIIPRLSTAHNYSFNSMPAYHFLCDMQTQGLRGGIGFYWGSLANEYDFLPRVKYKNTILSLAKWTIKGEDFKKMIEKKERQEILDQVKLWRAEKRIPRYVVLPDGDNDLFVDLENIVSIQALYSIVKKRPSFYLEEFPFDTENALVTDEKGKAYTNEFVFGFYKANGQDKNHKKL